MGGVDEVAGFNGKVDMDERIGSVGWVLSKGITPARSGNAGQGQEAVWNILGIRMSAPTVRNDHDGVTGPSRRAMCGNKMSAYEAKAEVADSRLKRRT
jgi:hypothetical protein